MPHLPQRVVNVADFFLCQFHEVLSRWREWEGVVFRGEGEDIQIIEALGLGGGRREASRGNVRDVTSEPGLQGEVGFLLTCNVYKPGMMFSILKCTGKSSTKELYLVQNVSIVTFEKLQFRG